MASTSGVHVSCRLRGLASDGNDDACVEAIQSPDVTAGSSPTTVAVQTASASHAFQFDRVFPVSATQQEVFDCIGRPCVQDLMLGYHCTILAHGQTGSGKTHTTIGSDNTADSQGLLPRLLEQLFAVVDSDEHRGFVSLSASFVEVYQERLRDLLAPIGRSGSSSSQLRIREDKTSGGVWVDGATDVVVSDLKTARAVVKRGLAQRAVGATRMNVESSRSHAVFALTMTRSSVDGGRSQTRARLCVVDLAGSEQAKKTKATGTRLDEAKHINKSLSALGNVIHALTSSVATPPPTAYVPYRDSKLTRLLQSSLGGNAKTYLLLTCASSACHLEESLSTLRFGARAKQMQNKPTVNRPLTSSPRTALLDTLEQKIGSLCRYIQELEKAAARRSEGCSRCADTSTGSGPGQQPTHEPEADDENVVAEADQPDEPSSNDAIMQAELLTLRKAMADMQRLQQHELSHALSLEQSVAQAEGVALVQLHERLTQDVERLDKQLDDADTQMATLQQQLRQSRENEQQLRDTLRQLEATAKREEAAREAEVEILRRRLEHVERQAKPMQAELLATRQEASELQRKMDQSESEERRLREENDALRKRIHAMQVDAAHAASVASCSSPPSSLVRSKPMLRPMTVALDSSGSPVPSNAIQSWWTGNNSEEEEDADVVTGRARRSPLADTGAASVAVQSNRSRLGTADSGGVRASGSRERPQLHTSGGSRPFRARLVGLLTSLEEETSSYKELLQVATDEAAATKGADRVTSSGRQRPSASRTSGHSSRKHRLPELERQLTSADEERDKR